jgi:hypothetical protein
MMMMIEDMEIDCFLLFWVRDTENIEILEARRAVLSIWIGFCMGKEKGFCALNENEKPFIPHC